MRFGFKTSPQNTTWPEMLSVWRAADDIELFESGWTFDHFYPIFSDPAGPCLEGWTTLTALAQATQRLRVGVLVTGVVYRHPAVLANMAASLDIVSGGRLEFGVGAAWNEEECEAYGIELGSLRERFDRFEEALQVMRGLLSTQATTTFSGRFYSLREAHCEPKPVQQPLPFVIGGNGEKRTLPLAARYGDHWNSPAATIAEFRHKRDVLHGCCAEIGRDPAELTTSTHIRMLPGMSPGEVAQLASQWADAGLDLGIVYLSPPHDPAVLEPLAEALAEVT